MKERTIVSACTMIGSLTAYYYAKHQTKDPAPLVMMGGFIGALLGEVVSQIAIKESDTNSSQNQTNSNKQLGEPK